MKVWILRFLKAREKMDEARQLAVLLRTADGEVAEVEILDIEGRNMNLPDVVEAQVQQGRPRIVFDLATEKQLDSNDLAQLIGAAKYVKDADGEMVFANPNARIQELLRITHLDEVMAIYDSIGAAAEHFSDRA